MGDSDEDDPRHVIWDGVESISGSTSKTASDDSTPVGYGPGGPTEDKTKREWRKRNWWRDRIARALLPHEKKLERINFLSLSDTPSSNSGSNKDSGNSGNGNQAPGQTGSSRQSSPQDAKEHREQLATGQQQARAKTPNVGRCTVIAIFTHECHVA